MLLSELARDRAIKPCYDQQSLMRRYDVVSEICDGMLALGWKPYQNDLVQLGRPIPLAIAVIIAHT